jgi:hypothetical protein
MTYLCAYLIGKGSNTRAAAHRRNKEEQTVWRNKRQEKQRQEGIHMWELLHLILHWIIGGTND